MPTKLDRSESMHPFGGEEDCSDGVGLGLCFVPTSSTNVPEDWAVVLTGPMLQIEAEVDESLTLRSIVDTMLLVRDLSVSDGDDWDPVEVICARRTSHGRRCFGGLCPFAAMPSLHPRSSAPPTKPRPASRATDSRLPGWGSSHGLEVPLSYRAIWEDESAGDVGVVEGMTCDPYLGSW